jgi:N-acetylglucosaminyldiphosphoundecaprenol N-acetyl-beta-D-mannosaminyltransferase
MGKARASERGRDIDEAPRDGQRVRLLGGEVDLVRPDEVMSRLHAAVRARRRAVIANHNLHSLYLLRRTPRLAEFFAAADVVQVDSTPLIAFGRLLGLPMRPGHRSTYLDWRDAFWRLARAEGWRVFYLGGASGVAERAAHRLTSEFPGALIGSASGYFDAAPQSVANRELLRRIADFAPDVLLVGMGMPRQELWIFENLTDLPDGPILSVGAAFDYEAGVQRAAPRWMGRLGLEWLFRLCCDPRRLFQRYCVEPWFLIGPAMSDLGRAWRKR